MIELEKKRLCESCFSPCKGDICPVCGFDPAAYEPSHDVIPCGSILMGKYIVGKVLGKGGFGITYLAYDIAGGKSIAVKEYYPMELAVREPEGTKIMVTSHNAAELFKKGLSKFYEEARLIAHLSDSPDVVHVYEFFYENNTAYFTMEYLSGMSLKKYLDENGVITSSQALNIALSVSGALTYVHSLRNGGDDSIVLHRDVSPDNIMLIEDGGIRLIDFGAARQVYPEGSKLMSVILKPGFAPFEQYSSKGKQGEWTDNYSLGASLFYSLTMNIPQDPMERMNGDDYFLENTYGINESLWNVIQKATMLKYTDRYQTTAEMLSELRAIDDIVPEKIIFAKNQERQFPLVPVIAGAAAAIALLLIILLIILL